MKCDTDDNLSNRLPFAALLKSHRRSARLTQEQLAQRAGISVRTISGLESGARHVPYQETVRLLAVALELSPQEASPFLAAAGRCEPSEPARIAAERSDTCHHAGSPLPAPVTPLLGRDSELASLGALLSRPDVRLLTLYGPPGAGKTRLAIAVATERAEAFAEGACFVSLAPVYDSAHVAATIAVAIGLRDTGNANLKEALIDTLRGQHALLLLDNFEHVMAAAPVVTELLEACPDLKILVTSRETLRVRGEQTFPVPPLALPGSDAMPLQDLLQIPSVQLFLDRAQRAVPTFALTPHNAPAISAICRRLDGLPLALELAAARVSLLAPERLLCQLDRQLSLLTIGPRDLLPRHQTLRDALAWSYDLLNDGERVLFRQFGVFAGGATLTAIEAVHTVHLCHQHPDAAPQGNATLDTVASLVNKSLLFCAGGAPHEQSDTRICILETMRTYAEELLMSSGAADASRRAHAGYFATSAAAAEDLRWPERIARYREFEADLDNFRAALRWAMSCQATEDVELGLRLAGALGTFWYMNGHLSEGAIWLHGLLARSQQCEPACAATIRAKALYMAGWIAIDQGEFAKAAALLTQSVALYRDTGEQDALALALNRCGDAALRLGENEQAEYLFSESLDVRRGEGNARGVAGSLNNLAAAAAQQKHYDRAQALLEEAYALYQSLGEHSSALFVLNNQADLERERGNYVSATDHCHRGIRLARRLGDRSARAHSLGVLACVARDQGDAETAAQLWRESLALQRQQGDDYAIAFCLHALATLERDQGRHAPALALYWESLLLHRRMAVTRGAVECLEGLASVAALEHADRAAELCGTIAALREKIGASERPAGTDSYERAVTLARAALGEERFEAAWSIGRHTSGHDLLASALALASTICQAY